MKLLLIVILQLAAFVVIFPTADKYLNKYYEIINIEWTSNDNLKIVNTSALSYQNLDCDIIDTIIYSWNVTDVNNTFVGQACASYYQNTNIDKNWNCDQNIYDPSDLTGGVPMIFCQLCSDIICSEYYNMTNMNSGYVTTDPQYDVTHYVHFNSYPPFPLSYKTLITGLSVTMAILALIFTSLFLGIYLTENYVSAESIRLNDFDRERYYSDTFYQFKLFFSNTCPLFLMIIIFGDGATLDYYNKNCNKILVFFFVLMIHYLVSKFVVAVAILLMYFNPKNWFRPMDESILMLIPFFGLFFINYKIESDFLKIFEKVSVYVFWAEHMIYFVCIHVYMHAYGWQGLILPALIQNTFFLILAFLHFLKSGKLCP